MSDFDVTAFVLKPSLDEFLSTEIRKDDLKFIATSFKLEFQADIRKAELKKLITKHLGGNDRDDLSVISVNDSQTLLEIERLKFETLRFKADYEREEREERKLEREHELKVLTLKQRSQSDNSNYFDASRCTKLIPPFSESNPETFFREFESTATHFNWPKEHWVWLVKPKLTGKALNVCEELQTTSTYDELREAILASYSITTEGYRQAFRNFIKLSHQTYTEFASEKLRLFKRWLKSAGVSTFEGMVNLIVFEEVKRKVPHQIMLHLIDKEETDLLKAARLADVFSLVHRHTPGDKKKVAYNVQSSAGSRSGPGDLAKEPNQTLPISKLPFCKFCKREGHVIKDCPDPRCKVSKQSIFTKPLAATNVTHESIDLFKAFRSQGTVSTGFDGRKFPVRVVRDTCCAQTVITKNVLPEIEEYFTGEKVYLDVIEHRTPVNLAKVCLQCDLVNGLVTVGVTEGPLPIPNADLLLGNDLAGDLVVPRLKVQDMPSNVNSTQELENDQPNLFPICVITRAQALTQSQTEEHPHGDLPTFNLSTELMTPEQLVKHQHLDPTLSKLHHQAVPGKDIDKNPSFYYKDKILMRFYRPPELSTEDTWAENHQIVLPCSVRGKIMEIAHEGFGGHLGIRKTYQKLLNFFYWPGMKRDVTQFINSCHTCQVMGRPNQTIPPYPLQPIKVPSEPFSKIIIDCVGPLPKTKKGNQYLLTVMCPTTRYPEAFPLKNISAKTIAKHLIHMFTTFGIPQEVQSDRGSNFTSNLFVQILKELGIKQSLSTAYHPESQGSLERWHQTLKSMLRKYCNENLESWDTGLDFMLFAIRETPQESLGYSPFELLFGRKVRGPLALVQEKWLQPPAAEPVTVSTFMQNLQKTLTKVRQLAKENLVIAQGKMKVHFDRTSKLREFKQGDKVLAYLPSPGSPMSARYKGPYEILKKVNDTNYVIATPDRKKPTQVMHINLLKLYVTRDPADDYKRLPCTAINVLDNTTDIHDVITLDNSSSNSNIMSNLPSFLVHLTQEQKSDIIKLIHKYPNVTSDTPGSCNVMQHDVELLPGTKPIRQVPYRIHPQKRQQMKEEVDYLLQTGLAVPSSSPWASPCILVPKEGGQLRLCTDYRRVNAVTVPDSYPIPRIDDLVDSIGKSKFISKIDLLKGYYQVRLTEKAQVISAFITPFGLYQYVVMPFGMRNSPATFQRIMNYLFQDMEGVRVYLDDILILANTWSQHLERLSAVLQKLDAAQLTIKLAKTTICTATVTYLGHVIGQGQVCPKEANVCAILDYPPPTNRKALMRFLGMAGFYRRYCPNFASVAAPLTQLTSGKVVFKWTEACQTSFDQLKNFLASKPVLTVPDFKRPFVLHTDASDLATGSVLLQEDEEGVLHPVAYQSSKLNKHQLSYSTVEKELLSIVTAIKKFECYLYGGPSLKIFTDHNPLTFLERNKTSNQRLLRWSLFLQPYNLSIHHIRGRDNTIADALSRTWSSTSGGTSPSNFKAESP